MKVREFKKILQDKMDDDEVMVDVNLFISHEDCFEELDITTDVMSVGGNMPVTIQTGWVELEVEHSYKFTTDHANLDKKGDYKRKNIEQMLLKRLAHMPLDKAMDYITKEAEK